MKKLFLFLTFLGLVSSGLYSMENQDPVFQGGNVTVNVGMENVEENEESSTDSSELSGSDPEMFTEAEMNALAETQAEIDAFVDVIYGDFADESDSDSEEGTV